MKKLKKQFVLVMVVVLAMQFIVARTSSALSAGSVVINEIAWAGSSKSSSDEWIELYNTTAQTVDLGGWELYDDGEASVMIESGEISPHGYFVIEDNEAAVESRAADLVEGLSLANSGDSLALKDADGILIDSVNDSGSAWYAGNVTDKLSMEKIDPMNFDDVKGNWASAIEVLATPGGINSNYAGKGPKVSLSRGGGTGNEIIISVEIDQVTNLYAYGFDINYDPDILSFMEAEESEFLNRDGTATAFNAANENGQEGTVVVGNARLVSPAEGISGGGELFQLTFEIIEELDDRETLLRFGAGSFLTDEIGDIPGKFNPSTIRVGQTLVETVAGLEISEGQDRYSLELGWETIPDADSYVIKRLGPDGSFVTIGETAENFWIDREAIIPQVNYKYQILVLKDGILGGAKEISGLESRGIVGDFDRSDRVDGRDIEKLARAYGLGYTDQDYDPLADSNFDGIVDGSDLIDVGVNFALSY